MIRPSKFPRRCARLAVASVVGALLVGSLVGPQDDAQAAVPVGSPTFSDPTTIDNAFFPFQSGAVSVYAGRSRGDAVTIVVRHTAETRAFDWNATTVECRVLEELVFEGGVVTGTEQLFVAQADDGSVWTFGEVEDDDPTDDGGNDAEESGGWIVGSLASGDPEGVTVTNAPALLMPATPERGDRWMVSDAPPHHLVELRIRSDDARARTRAGRFRDCLRVVEADLPDDTREQLWFAPGVGLVRSKGRRERVSLRASSLVPRSRR